MTWELYIHKNIDKICDYIFIGSNMFSGGIIGAIYPLSSKKPVPGFILLGALTGYCYSKQLLKGTAKLAFYE